MMEHRHPAYNDPSFPTNVLFAYMTDPKTREGWAEPLSVAAAMYKLVGQGRKIPLRLPLGSDSWQMIMADIDSTKNELLELKDLSSSIDTGGSADTLKNLSK
jgi:hypothetical protein